VDAGAGDWEEAENLTSGWQRDPLVHAMTYAGLGDKDRTLESPGTYGSTGAFPGRPSPHISGTCASSWRPEGESPSQKGWLAGVVIGAIREIKRRPRLIPATSRSRPH